MKILLRPMCKKDMIYIICIIIFFVIPFAKGSAQCVVVNEIMVSNTGQCLSPAKNYDGWIELFNNTDAFFSFEDKYLSDNVSDLKKWSLSKIGGGIKENAYCIIWFGSNDINPLQAPFKLKRDGGKIIITDGNEIILEQNYPQAMPGMSYARIEDGIDNWSLSYSPSPGFSNNGGKFASEELSPPSVFPQSSLFKSSLQITVESETEESAIRMTTDGSEPTMENGYDLISFNFNIDTTSIFRFRAFKKGFLPSKVITRSFIRNDNNFSVPVVSVVADRRFLYNDTIGIMVKGHGGKPGFGEADSCNWNMNWQRPVHFSYMSSNGDYLFGQDVNMEISGGHSRAHLPRPFSIKANKKFETKKTLDYPFFDAKPYIRNRTLRLRNGGDDSTALLKDPYIQEMIRSSGIDIDVLSYQPCVHFINGEYKGLINMREPNNKYYVYANYGLEEEEIDLFEMNADSGYIQKCGTDEVFLKWYDLSFHINKDGVYQDIIKIVDVDEYINYMALEFFLAMRDWPRNNLKAFRKRDGGRYRFVLYDTDEGFHYWQNPFTRFEERKIWTFDYLYNKQTCITEEIKMITIFLNMIKNDDFRKKFIDTFCIIGGSVFEHKKAIQFLDEMADKISPLLSVEGKSPQSTVKDIKERLNNYEEKLVNYMKEYEPMQLSDKPMIKAKITSNTQHAYLYFNDILVPHSYFDGHLFLPAVIKADNINGYVFRGWKSIEDGEYLTKENEIDLSYYEKYAIEAVYEPLEEQALSPISINEVCADNDYYANEYWKTGNWIELYNRTNSDISIEGCYISDDMSNPYKYQLNSNLSGTDYVVPSHGYKVIWCDKYETNLQVHVPIILNTSGGNVIITASDRVWSDELEYTCHVSSETVGRYPDGSDNIYIFTTPTIEKRNRISSYSYLTDNNSVPSSIIQSLEDNIEVKYTTDYIFVLGEDLDKVHISLISVDGKTLIEREIRGDVYEYPISISNIPSGVYICKLENKNGMSFPMKIVKK